MTPAELARDNAISFECKKDALQQRQSGDWKISFTVQGIDMDERITRAPMGTRFVAVLVAINDDESPVQQPAKERAKPTSDVSPATPRRLDKPAGAKRDWNDLQPAQQAGIRSGDSNFIEFLQKEYTQEWLEHGDAADCIRSICGVHSRAELGTDSRKRVLWNQLDKHFQAWDAKVRLNA
jgi:hypothetical protein